MIMICNVPDEVVKSVKMGTWCGSSVVEEMIAKGMSLNEVIDKIRAEIETKYGQCKLTEYIVQYDGICTSTNDIGDIADILQILDKYRAESEET